MISSGSEVTLDGQNAHILLFASNDRGGFFPRDLQSVYVVNTVSSPYF
jgi:hypothetical protein